MSDFKTMCAQLNALADTDCSAMPLLSNASALIAVSMEDVSWAGFYLCKDGHLVLGPFQGKPACIHIAYGRGVCGASVENDEILQVGNVATFPGYIACDAEAQSELVIPLHKNGEIFGVLDLDSNSLARFTGEDVEGLAAFAAVLEERIIL